MDAVQLGTTYTSRHFRIFGIPPYSISIEVLYHFEVIFYDSSPEIWQHLFLTPIHSFITGNSFSKTGRKDRTTNTFVELHWLSEDAPIGY